MKKCSECGRVISEESPEESARKSKYYEELNHALEEVLADVDALLFIKERKIKKAEQSA